MIDTADYCMKCIHPSSVWQYVAFVAFYAVIITTPVALVVWIVIRGKRR